MVALKLLGISVLGVALALPAYADRGSSAYKKGVRAERQANLDAAYGFYNQAGGADVPFFGMSAVPQGIGGGRDAMQIVSIVHVIRRAVTRRTTRPGGFSPAGADFVF